MRSHHLYRFSLQQTLLCAMSLQVVPGELTIITGVPNSGKSEWIDAMLVNLAWQHGWCFAMCSMEKKVRHPASTALQQQWCGQRL